MNKKAMDQMWWVVIGAIMALFLLAVFFFIFKGPIFGASSQINVVMLQKSRDACQNEMDKPYPPTDEDKDGFPDNIQRLGFWCDLCLGGNDNLDDDGDGVPNECDKNANTPFDPKKSSFEDECKNPDKGKNRCIK